MNKVHLQGVGDVNGTPSELLKVGDVLTWNFGYKSTIIYIVRRTAKSVIIRTRSHDTGAEYERRLMFGRFVAANV